MEEWEPGCKYVRHSCLSTAQQGLRAQARRYLAHDGVPRGGSLTHRCATLTMGKSTGGENSQNQHTKN